MIKLPPVMCTTVVDEERGVRGYVVADSLFGGRAMGGIRTTRTVTMEDVMSLARNMTLKLALAELPIGGAKGGLVCGLESGAKKDEAFRAYGRLVGPMI